MKDRGWIYAREVDWQKVALAPIIGATVTSAVYDPNDYGGAVKLTFDNGAVLEVEETMQAGEVRVRVTPWEVVL